MRRTILGSVALAAFAFPCLAGPPSSNSETLIRLTVDATPAPKPAMRYMLLPELKEMNPGNPIQNYLKCFMEQQRFFFDKEAYQRRDKLLTMPLKELPAEELRNYGQSALRQADWAARLDNPDWQILLKLKADGISLLLPEVQQLRSLATALKVRFRAEVALGRFDDAIRTAKTMFALSRHLGEHPTFIADLVGIAIAFVAIGPLEEMLEQPGCPNLYWALTNMPNPLVPLYKGREGERAVVLAEFRDLDDSAPMSADQIKRFIAHWDTIIRLQEGTTQKFEGLRVWLDARIKDEGMVGAARRRLVESGFSQERLLQFPAEQVILLDEKRECELRHDDVMKIVTLPPWQAESMYAQLKLNKKPALFADMLVPLAIKIHHAQGRLQQRIALLRHVEALRLYAAEHNGALPAKLSDFTVPLTDDPFTGKPFRYEVIGNTAHLRGTPPPGQDIPAYNIHYEVTLRK